MYAVSAPTAVYPPLQSFPIDHYHESESCWSSSWSEKVLITSRYGKSIDYYHDCKRGIWEGVIIIITIWKECDYYHDCEPVIWAGVIIVIIWKGCWLSSRLWKGDLGKVWTSSLNIIIWKVLVIIMTVKGWLEKVLIIVIIWKECWLPSWLWQGDISSNLWPAAVAHLYTSACLPQLSAGPLSLHSPGLKQPSPCLFTTL